MIDDPIYTVLSIELLVMIMCIPLPHQTDPQKQAILFQK